MPTPEDRSFFEGLNSDLAKGINKAIEGGFKGASLSLDDETVKLIGIEFSQAVKPLEKAIREDDDGGGGGGSGSAGQQGSIKQVVNVAKGVFGAARQLVAQNASNMLAYGDTMARGVAATNQAFLMNGGNLSTKFGHFGFNIQQQGVMLDSAMRANVKGLNKSTQNFMARSAGLGTSNETTNKFLATNTNILGKSMEETVALGTDLENIALSNGMLGDSIFAAVAAFEANTKAQQVIFGTGVATEFQKIVGGLEGIVAGGNTRALIAKAGPTTVKGLLNLDILGGMAGGAFNSRGISEDPQRHTANFIASLAQISKELPKQTPRQSAQIVESIYGALGITLSDIQTAGVLMDEAGGIPGLMKAMKAGKIPIKTDEEYSRSITENSITAANNMKNAAIELAGLATVQGGLLEMSDTLRGSFWDLNDEVSKLAKTMGAGAAGEAMLQSADKLGLGGVIKGITSIASAGAVWKGGKWAVGKFRPAKPTLPVEGVPKLPTIPPTAVKPTTPPVTPPLKPAGYPTPQLDKAKPALPPSKPITVPKSGANTLTKLGKGALKRVPVATALIGGGLEYAQNEDISRAVTVGAAQGGGFIGGAAAGASLAALTGPLYPVTGPLFGLIGGMLGSWGTGEVAKVVHDSIDTDFVQKQEEDKAKANKVLEEEANAQESAKEEVTTKSAAAQLDAEEEQVRVLGVISESLLLSNSLLAQLASDDFTPRATRTYYRGTDIASTQRG